MVVVWGAASYGGASTAVKDQLKQWCADCRVNLSAFTIVKTNGDVVTWGDDGNGGDSGLVKVQTGGVREIVGTAGAFAAVNVDVAGISWATAITAAIAVP